MLYIYAPAGFAALLAFVAAVAASVLFLRTKGLRFDALAVSATEVGLVFLTVNIVAGVVWSRLDHGRLWTWDPALTSALVCGLLYASYLMLRRALEEPSQRAAFSAVWSIFCFLDIPIIVAAVYRWRSKHPQPALWSTLPVAPLAGSTVIALLVAGVLLWVHMKWENTRRERESARRYEHVI
jgi:heme exporter protein C